MCCEKGGNRKSIEESVGVELHCLNIVEKSKKGRKVHQLT
jgi:hypothetical protein